MSRVLGRIIPEHAVQCVGRCTESLATEFCETQTACTEHWVLTTYMLQCTLRLDP